MRPLVNRYFKLWSAFFRNSLSRDMEFKSNFLFELIIDAAYYSSLFFFFKIIFQFVDAVGKFNHDAMIIFLILLYIIDSLYIFILGGNVFNVNDKVKKGDLDFILIKPVNPQFFLSFRYVNAHALISIFVLSILLIVLTYSYHNDVLLLINYLLCLLSIALGIIIFYSIEFLIACLSFWFRNFSYAGWLSGELTKYARRPDPIYKKWFRNILFTFLPMAMIASVPARLLLFGLDETKLLLLQFCVAFTFLWLTTFVWKRGLQVYESASS